MSEDNTKMTDSPVVAAQVEEEKEKETDKKSCEDFERKLNKDVEIFFIKKSVPYYKKFQTMFFLAISKFVDMIIRLNRLENPSTNDCAPHISSILGYVKDLICPLDEQIFGPNDVYELYFELHDTFNTNIELKNELFFFVAFLRNRYDMYNKQIGNLTWDKSLENHYATIRQTIDTLKKQVQNVLLVYKSSNNLVSDLTGHERRKKWRTEYCKKFIQSDCQLEVETYGKTCERIIDSPFGAKHKPEVEELSDDQTPDLENSDTGEIEQEKTATPLKRPPAPVQVPDNDKDDDIVYPKIGNDDNDSDVEELKVMQHVAVEVRNGVLHIDLTPEIQQQLLMAPKKKKAFRSHFKH